MTISFFSIPPNVLGTLNSLVVFGASTDAFAATANCQSPIPTDQQYFSWTHQTGGLDDVTGVRAGIKFLKNSDLCPFSITHQVSDYIWISVQRNPATSATQIVQMGFIHDYNPFEDDEWCLFWADPATGADAQNYRCTGYSNDDEENFSIHQDSGASNYVMDDCGKNTADWSNCVQEGGLSPDWTLNRAAIAIEEHNGSFGEQQWGYSGDQEKVGSAGGSGDPELVIQGLASGTWDVCDWGTGPDEMLNCANGSGSGSAYNWFDADTGPVHGVKFFDGRNTDDNG